MVKGVNVAIIGAGARGRVFLRLCLSGIRENINVTAIADTNMDKMNKLLEDQYKGRQEELPKLYLDYEEMLDNEEIDAVFICTNDTTHKVILFQAMNRGKNILIEKPLATTIDDCLQIYKKSIGYNKVIKLGFVLRYTKFYKKIKEIVQKGELGNIISVEAKEMLSKEHAASYFRRWHRFKKNNGGFLNAKCSHDIDLLNWLIDSEPVNVSAFGSRIFFNEKKEASLRCRDCKLKNTCKYFASILEPTDPGYFWLQEGDLCVFNADKDIVDHEVLTVEYMNGVTAAFNASMFGAKGNRTMVIFGSDAVLNADFSEGIIQVGNIGTGDELIYRINMKEEGHGGGDDYIFSEFIDSIRTGPAGTDSNEVYYGMMSSLIALSGEVCMDNKIIMNIRSILDEK